MSLRLPANPNRPLRWLLAQAVVALGALALCACRSPQVADVGGMGPGASPALPQAAGAVPAVAAGLPGEAYQAMPVGYPAALPAQVPLGPDGVGIGPAPVPFCPLDPSTLPPPAVPWSAGEYLCDGGDSGLRVGVSVHGQLSGLDPEDTVAYYQTPDGRALVEPSNQVRIYSPRFRAVRQVVGPESNEQSSRLAGVYLPTGLIQQGELAKVRSSKQNEQALRDVGTRSPTTYRSRQGKDVLARTLGPQNFQNAFQPFEDFSAIRLGAFQEAEMARLLKAANAAIVWSARESVQVILDEQKAAEEAGHQYVGTVYGINTPPAHPRLRIVKVASTQFAEPGETVDFTLRFDNVGDQPIGAVTVLDSLSTRLEYVPQSAQCNLPAQFSAAPNEAGSSVLQWQIGQALRPGQGGIIRFRCMIR